MKSSNRVALLTFIGVGLAGCASASDPSTAGTSDLSSTPSSARGVGDACWTKAQSDVQGLSGHPAYVTSVVSDDEKYVVSTKGLDGASVDYWVTFSDHSCTAYPQIVKLPSAEPPSEYSVCQNAAVKAVETRFGVGENASPLVNTIKDEVKYEVSVGVGAGAARDFWVTFSNGCSSVPTVEEVPVIVPALQGAAHDAYAALLTRNAYAFPAANAVSSSALPAGAKDSYDGFVQANQQFGNVCSSIDAYEVDVTGQKTFAVTCTLDVAGLEVSSMSVFDASGVLVDSGSFLRAPGSPATESVTWNNTSHEATAD